MNDMIGIRNKLRDKIAEQMKRTSDALSAGRFSSLEEAKQYVGRLQGHRDALEAVDAVFNRLFDEGD